MLQGVPFASLSLRGVKSAPQKNSSFKLSPNFQCHRDRQERAKIDGGGDYMRILLAEDDQFLANGLSMALSNTGYAVDRVVSGTEADLALGVTKYDLLILDLGLPQLDGLEVLKRLRVKGLSLPVLILTARDGLEDRVLGLDLGANDYLTKPFQLPELEARIRALLRGGHWANKTEIVCGPIRFDTVGRSCVVDGQPLELSARELAVLEILLQNVGRVISKAQITERLSSLEAEVTFNAIEIVMHRLRKKLDHSGFTIRTLRGLGYLIEKRN
jgi:two-component system OmpR family response regulator